LVAIGVQTAKDEVSRKEGHSAIHALMQRPAFQACAAEAVKNMRRARGDDPQQKLDRMCTAFFNALQAYNREVGPEAQILVVDREAREQALRAALLLQGEQLPELLLKMERLYLAQPSLAVKPEETEQAMLQAYFRAEFVRDALDFCSGVDPLRLAERLAKKATVVPAGSDAVELVDFNPKSSSNAYRRKIA